MRYVFTFEIEAGMHNGCTKSKKFIRQEQNRILLPLLQRHHEQLYKQQATQHKPSSCNKSTRKKD